jgi:hypothetical protein
VVPLRIEGRHGLGDAVGAGGVVGAGHHGLPAGAGHGLGDGGRVGGDRHGADAGLHGAAPHMHDHGLARDVGERLVGQARRAEARGDQNEGIGHGTPVR